MIENVVPDDFMTQRKFRDAIFYVAENRAKFKSADLEKLDKLKKAALKTAVSASPNIATPVATPSGNRSPQTSSVISAPSVISSLPSRSVRSVLQTIKPNCSNGSSSSAFGSRRESFFFLKSKKDPMKAYIDLVCKLAPEVRKLLQEEEDYFRQRFVSKEIGLQDSFQPTPKFQRPSMEEISLPHADHMTFERLYTRLGAFYKEHDVGQLRNGIGDLVSFGVQFGEDELNLKLEHKYGVDLKQFESDIAARKKLMRKQIRDARIWQKELMKSHKSKKRKEIHRSLYYFFKKVDPEMVLQDLRPLVKEARETGLDELNYHLRLKYGVDLENYRELDVEQSFGRQFSLEDTIDESTLHYLKLFYAKFNPQRVADGGFIQVYEWAQRNGLETLNNELERRFHHSFNLFKIETMHLDNELKKFYAKHDPSVLDDSEEKYEKVLVWALRNSRTALNIQLEAKYNANLD